MVITAILGAPFFFRWFFPHYVAAIPYTQVYSLVLLFIPFIFFNETLNMHGRIKELYWARLIVPPARIILLIAMVPWWGLWGAIAAIFATKFLTLAVYAYIFKKLW